MSDILDPIISSGAFQAASTVLGIIGALAAVALLVWMYRDAESRQFYALAWVIGGTVLALVAAWGGMSLRSWGLAPIGLGAVTAIGVLLVVYRILRPFELSEDAVEQELALKLLRIELQSKACPRCSAAVETDFLLCPNCGLELRRPCNFCRRPIKAPWRTCPYCGAGQGQ